MVSEVSQGKQGDEKDLGYEIFIALLSLLSIFNLVFVLLPSMSQESVNLVEAIDLALTFVFLFDFGYRITTTRSKSYYFFYSYGWADLLSCVPQLRILRLFRLVKAYRLIKKKGTKTIIHYLSYQRAEAALYILIFCVIIIVEVGASAVLIAESKSAEANITTADNALWWAYETVTSVGYGDTYPVTNLGRLLGAIVMATGVAIFATLAGYLSNKLITPPKIDEEKKPEEATSPFEKQVITGMDEIKSSLSQQEIQQEMKNQEIVTRLEKLENLLSAEK
jgi:voltage-gated potassium channel